MSSPIDELVLGGTLTLDTTEHQGVRHVDVPGGSALYATAGAGLLVPTRVVGVVGADFPLASLDSLGAAFPVDRSEVLVRAGQTFRWKARYSANGDARVTLARDAGVAADYFPALCTTPRGPYAVLLGSMHPEAQLRLLNSCVGARRVGLDSMGHWWGQHADTLLALVSRAHVVFADEEELARATGVSSTPDGADWLLERGPEIVVVKRGSRGAWMRRRGQHPLATGAAPVARVVDATGAGDTFAGAFLAALGAREVEGDAFALRFAAAMASFAVEGVGTAALVGVTLVEAERRMGMLWEVDAAP